MYQNILVPFFLRDFFLCYLGIEGTGGGHTKYNTELRGKKTTNKSQKITEQRIIKNKKRNYNKLEQNIEEK